MSYQAKPIPEREFFDLAELHHLMVISSPFSADSVMASTEQLLIIMKGQASMMFGLYKDDELVGFATGHALSAATYYWAGLFVAPAHRKEAKLLIDTFEAKIKELSFTAIEADGTTAEGIAMMERYDYSPKMTRYRKELVWAES